jgi:hypothetical protein
MRSILTCSSLTVVMILLVGACSRSEAPPAPSASASAPAPSASAAAPASVERGSEELRPVYPVDAGPPDPVAQGFCEAIYMIPEKRKAECCGGAPSAAAAGVVDLCVRTLSYALAHKAVILTPRQVSACITDLTRATSNGCDWAVPNNIELPPSCDGVIQGTLPEKAPCRSSLECADGLRCQGLSTIDLGTCGSPREDRYPCNLAIDTLAAHTRQARVDERHPECAGYCARGRCAEALADGAACATDLQCGRGRCDAGKCTHAPLPSAGEPCAGACAFGARCVKGTCAAPKAEGEGCEVNEECRGVCVRGDGGAAGKCEKLCAMPAPHIKLPPPGPAKPGPKRR